MWGRSSRDSFFNFHPSLQIFDGLTESAVAVIASLDCESNACCLGIIRYYYEHVPMTRGHGQLHPGTRAGMKKLRVFVISYG